MKVALLAALLTGAVLAAASRASPPTTPAGFDVSQFLRANAGFSESEIQRTHRGDVIVGNLAVDDHTVGIAATALIAVPPAFFMEQVRDIEEFKKSPEVQQIGRFAHPPSLDDLAQLTIEKGDVDAVRHCRAGDCDFKLDARGIERLRAVPASGDVTAALRAHLVDYVSTYHREGNAALVTYHDRSQPQSLLAEFERIMTASPFIEREWPDLYNGIARFTGTLPAGLDGFTYWSKEKVGPRSAVSLTHLMIRAPQEGVGVVATKQIYASHYTTASLGLTVLVDQSDTRGPRTLVVYLNRTRVDIFGGILGGLKRPLVRSRAKSGAERMMVTLRTKLESEYRLQGKIGSN